MQAIELARKHGWTEEPVAAVAYSDLGRSMAWQGRLGEAEGWLDRAERALRTEAQPAAHLLVHYARGLLELARGRNEKALSAFQAAQRPEEALVIPHTLATRTRARVLQIRVRLGQAEWVEQAIAQLDEDERETGQMRIVLAALRLSQGDPQAATAALAPALQDIGSAKNLRTWLVEGFMLEAIARNELGDAGAVRRALESALDLAEPDGLVLPFLLHPAAELLKYHSRHGTPHVWLISQILDLLVQGGSGGIGLPGQDRNSSGNPGRIAPPEATLHEPLSQSEIRVLRYLPTNLTVPEMAAELHLSVNTVRTHMSHLYTKLSVHRRREAVEQARALGLLGPSTRRR
jgi:LuxR family maltose regulon positive regulatory protein